jgi:hypothetical protein
MIERNESGEATAMTPVELDELQQKMLEYESHKRGYTPKAVIKAGSGARPIGWCKRVLDQVVHAGRKDVRLTSFIHKGMGIELHGKVFVITGIGRRNVDLKPENPDDRPDLIFAKGGIVEVAGAKFKIAGLGRKALMLRTIREKEQSE